MQIKTCTTCKKDLDLNSKNYRISKTRKDGNHLYRYECRNCERNRTKNWKKENPSLLKQQKKRYIEKTRDSSKHILKRLLKLAKRRAKEKNIECSINEQNLNWTGVCPVLGVELKPCRDKCSSNSPTLDRMKNEEGYIEGNVQIISFKANSIKGNATADEIYKVALYAEQCEGKGNRFTRWLKRTLIKML